MNNDYSLLTRNNNLNIVNNENNSRNSYYQTFNIDSEKNNKINLSKSFKESSDSKISVSNVNLSGLKINNRYSKELNGQNIKIFNNINNKTQNSFFTDDKNSLFSNQFLQDKNDVYYNQNNLNSDSKLINLNSLNNDLNISTIDNLNSSINDNNMSFSSKNDLRSSRKMLNNSKNLSEIRNEILEKKKANQKLIQEVNLKTNRKFFDEDNEFDNESFKNKSINFQNHNNNFALGEKKKKIEDLYRNKNLLSHKELDLISGNKHFKSGYKFNESNEEEKHNLISTNNLNGEGIKYSF